MVGHVTLITQQLFVGVLLDAADVAVTPLTVLLGVILTALTLGSI